MQIERPGKNTSNHYQMQNHNPYDITLVNKYNEKSIWSEVGLAPRLAETFWPCDHLSFFLAACYPCIKLAFWSLSWLLHSHALVAHFSFHHSFHLRKIASMCNRRLHQRARYDGKHTAALMIGAGCHLAPWASRIWLLPISSGDGALRRDGALLTLGRFSSRRRKWRRRR